MLKQRVIATLFLRNDIVVQSIGFQSYLPVGRPEIAAEAYSNWGVDEILLVDMSATKKQSSISLDIVERVAAKCAVPLTVGGGLRHVETMNALLEAGADKVCVNAALLDHDKCISDGRKKFGRQCMVGAIDFVRQDKSRLVYDYRNNRPTNKPLMDAVDEAVTLGCGEIFINDVERDGSQIGFDTTLIETLTSACPVPVIWCGGAGGPDHFVQAFTNCNLSGVAAGNIFHFCEHSINIIKSKIAKTIDMRQDTQANYNNMPVTKAGRISKLPEEELDNLLYEKLKVDVI